MKNPLTYWLILLKASFFSMGGLNNLPSLHHDLLAQRWASEADFGEAIAIGQLSPGPNGLWVISLGYLTYGWLGSLLALIAITIPPMLILPLEVVYHRIEQHGWAQALLRSLSLVSIGLLLSATWSILEGHTGEWSSWLICLTACGLSLSRRVSTLPILLTAAGAGLLLYGWR
jgi:chromate transporter